MNINKKVLIRRLKKMMSLQLPKEHAIISDNYKELYGQRTQPRVWIRQFWTGQGVIAMITRCCTN